MLRLFVIGAASERARAQDFCRYARRVVAVAAAC